MIRGLFILALVLLVPLFFILVYVIGVYNLSLIHI